MNKEIDQVFWSTWLAVSQLRSGADVEDGTALFRQACHWVDSAGKILREKGYSEQSVEHMLYTQCALLDESVLNRKRHDNGYSTWLATPLQARYFNTTNAGEELWERIRTVLREPAPDTAVLTCFYRAVTLGFVGRYREQGDERREDVLEALASQAHPFRLQHDTPVVIRATGYSGGQRRWWLGWIAGIVVLFTLWGIFSHVLQGLVAQLVGQG
ncbi:type VI secretion system protein TssL, short form [Enterobacter sp.]|uniref:type VI secretion system protein TssL, short form n=1 Tax=Enterobacter sp. TaxID=42895 RepID=UPI003993A26B